MQKNFSPNLRPKRETREISSLKKENSELRRTIKRLEKEVKKREPPDADEPPAATPRPSCECGGDTREFVFNRKVFLVCTGCKARKVIKIEQ